MIDVSIHPRWCGDDDTFSAVSYTAEDSHWAKLVIKNAGVVIFTATRDQADRLADLLNEIAGRKKPEEVQTQQEV